MKGMFEPTLAIVKTWFHVLEVEYAGDLLLSKIDEKRRYSQTAGIITKSL